MVTDRCVLNHHNRTGSFKMKRFEIFCSDPFTHQPGEWPERYAAPRASLDVAVRAGTEQTTPRGLDAAVSGFGGPCTLPLRRRRCDARAQERKHVRMSAGPRLIDAPAPIATPSCSGTRCALRLAQTGPEEVSVRRNSWPRSRPHWCVRDCDAVSQQDLEEETGCGQADCSIMPGTCKLHDPACHCALAFLLGAALPSAGGNAQKCAKKTHK